MQLDLSGKEGSGEKAAADSMELVAEEIRRPFVDLIDRLSASRGADLDWWVTPLASRNTYACPLHLRLCHLVLARRLAQAGGINEVVVDSPALAKAIARVAGPGVRVSVAGGAGRARLARFIGVLRRYAGSLYHALCPFFFARLFLPRSARLPANPIVLVDTFFYTESVVDGQIRDRHYPGMMDHLDAAERGCVFFAPSYYRIRNYARFFRGLRQVRENLILKEDVLGPDDYLFALGHPFRLRWPWGRFDFLDMDVGPLVREALAESFAGSGAIEGLLRYRFARRLQESGLRPRRIVEWFENQEIDHGANAGWRIFFPDTPVIGYQGFFASRHYLCMFPMTREADLRLLPNYVAVMGQGLVEAAREFCPALGVDIAPSFRFDSVWRARGGEPDAKWFTILVSLPILPGESRTILNLAVRSAGHGKTNPNRPWRFYLKFHPTWSRRDMAHLAGGLPEGFEVVEGDFETLLDQSDALLGAASSTCVHAIARGVPVAVAGRPGGLVQNPIPAFADAALWAVCYTAVGLGLTLGRYADGDPIETERRRKLGRSFRERVFEPVTRESVRRFLGFDEAGLVVDRTPAIN